MEVHTYIVRIGLDMQYACVYTLILETGASTCM